MTKTNKRTTIYNVGNSLVGSPSFGIAFLAGNEWVLNSGDPDYDNRPYLCVTMNDKGFGNRTEAKFYASETQARSAGDE
jgi:hypothetical protein